MDSFDDFIAPVTREQFEAEYAGRKPLHIPASADHPNRAALLSWSEMNGLLAQSSIWTPTSLKMVFNNEPIDPAAYCSPIHIHGGLRSQPQPGKMNGLLAMGASLIAEDAQYLTPALRTASRTLSHEFAALVAVNIYCSFKGVQAFGPHFDLHDVFAVQTEGEKIWRLYANQADRPVGYPEFDDPRQTRQWLNQTKGDLVSEVRMRPGDVLYVPRGWYHDAIAVDGASLHATFSVTPLYGRLLFSLLETAAMQDPAFRAWLPAAARNNGADLSEMLSDLGRRLAELAAGPGIHDEVAMAQQKLQPRDAGFDLPRQPALTLLRRTGMPGPMIKGLGGQVVEWALTQPQVALEDMIAQFDFIPETVVRDAIDACRQSGALKPV
ncbi:MAG: JmjC domain-containing protein [Brevundimonas sp.]|uniref:JmjC domain-containing protein n=1 Tax=Brevundimonas sp. TaxID=1871086 RepID=UPI00391A872F